MPTYPTLLSDSTRCIVTQVYGSGHLGTDIQFLPIRWSNLYFPKDGVINSVSLDPSYGLHYQVYCSDGTEYRMAHLQERVKGVGDTVTAGMFAGVQGNTGNTSGPTGIHLHLEYFVEGNRTSPATLMGFPDALGTYDIEWGSPTPPTPEPPYTPPRRLPVWMMLKPIYRRR